MQWRQVQGIMPSDCHFSIVWGKKDTYFRTSCRVGYVFNQSINEHKVDPGKDAIGTCNDCSHGNRV